MNRAWLAVPILLVAALGIAVFLGQPKQSSVQLPDSGYVDVNGDQYSAQEYMQTPEDALRSAVQGLPSDFVYPVKISDCDSYADRYARERCLVLYTQRSGDPKGCEPIQGIESKDACYFDAAVDSKKPALCENITYGKQECYMQAAIETKDATTCAKAAANIKGCENAVDAGDVAKCPLGDDQQFCGDAVLAKDKSLCRQMRSYDEACYLQIAVDTNNSSLCNRTGTSQDHCFFKVANSVNNPAICESIGETAVRDNCVAWVAFNTGNTQLCYQAGSEAQSCLDDLSG
ncbi:Uncharacterised protein [uncultured archaeon]|nr:Uncharacterised protein [uncultured archaeon]